MCCVDQLSRQGRSDMGRRPAMIVSAALDPGCVKTHASAKCRKCNSPTRHRSARGPVRFDSRMRNFFEIILLARRAPTFSHGQDPKRTLRAFGCGRARRYRAQQRPCDAAGLTAAQCESDFPETLRSFQKSGNPSLDPRFRGGERQSLNRSSPRKRGPSHKLSGQPPRGL